MPASLFCRTGVILMVAWVVCAPTRGSTPIEIERLRSPTPHSTILFQDARRFIALEKLDCLALYRTDKPGPIHRFSRPQAISAFKLSPDESILVIGTDGGELSGWDPRTGRMIWSQTPAQTGLREINKLSFAHNGACFIACDFWHGATVRSARTGLLVAECVMPPGHPAARGAALSPDGSGGFLSDEHGSLFAFRNEPWSVVETGFTGRVLCCSADGKYVICEARYSTSRLRSITWGKPGSARQAPDVGAFSQILRVRPLADGSVLVTACQGERLDKIDASLGFRYWPASGELKQIWRFEGSEARDTARMDFSADAMIGVGTDLYLRTRVTDLRTGLGIWAVDNSANLPTRPTPTPDPFEFLEKMWVQVACVVGGLLALIVGFRLIRRKWNQPPMVTAV